MTTVRSAPAVIRRAYHRALAALPLSTAILTRVAGLFALGVAPAAGALGFPARLGGVVADPWRTRSGFRDDRRNH